MDRIGVGCSPVEEDCVQVRRGGNYEVAMKAELEIYKRQLQRTYPVPEGVDAYFKITWFPHDFGRYGEIEAVYDDCDKAAIDWAYEAENGCDRWDEQALAERAQAGLPAVSHA